MSALRGIIMNDIISIVNSVLNSNSSSVVEDSFEKDDIYSFYERYCQDKSVRESIYKWLNRDDLIKLVSDLDDSFYNTDLVSQFFSYFNMVNQDKDDFYNFFLLLKKNFQFQEYCFCFFLPKEAFRHIQPVFLILQPELQICPVSV